MSPHALIAPSRRAEPLGFVLRMVRQFRYWRDEMARIVAMDPHSNAVFEDASVKAWRDKQAHAASRLPFLDGEIALWVEEARALYLAGERVAEPRARELGVWEILGEVSAWAVQYRRNAVDLAAFEDGVAGHPVEVVQTVPASGGWGRASGPAAAAGR